MTDRELLELAAKACSQEYWITRLGPRTSITEHLHYQGGNGKTEVWNPLTNDGDALRVAVKLAICVNQGNGVVIAERSAAVNIPEIGVIEALSDDYCAATRRAIVRAAAEIGKRMESGL